MSTTYFQEAKLGIQSQNNSKGNGRSRTSSYSSQIANQIVLTLLNVFVSQQVKISTELMDLAF